MPTTEDQDTELANKETTEAVIPVSNCCPPLQCAMAAGGPFVLTFLCVLCA